MKAWIKGGLIAGVIFLILWTIIYVNSPKPFHVDNEIIAFPLVIIIGMIIGYIVDKIKSKKVKKK